MNIFDTFWQKKRKLKKYFGKQNLNMLQKVTWVQSWQVFQLSQQQIGSYILGKAKRKKTFSSFTFLYYTTTHRIIFHILKKLDIIIFQYQSFSALLIKFVSHPKILTEIFTRERIRRRRKNFLVLKRHIWPFLVV